VSHRLSVVFAAFNDCEQKVARKERYTSFVYLKSENNFKQRLLKANELHINDLSYKDEGGRIHLANIGFEAQTFLYHIITHYDRLTDYVAFIPGGPKSPKAERAISKLLHLVSRRGRPPGKFYHSLVNADGVWYIASTRTPPGLREWVKRCRIAYEYLFGCSPVFHAKRDLHATFVVSRETITSRPIEFYIRAYNLVNVNAYRPWHNSIDLRAVPYDVRHLVNKGSVLKLVGSEHADVPFWGIPSRKSNAYVGLVGREGQTHKSTKNIDWGAACFFEYIWQDMFCRPVKSRGHVHSTS
jgi:hypothetical protein